MTLKMIASKTDSISKFCYVSMYDSYTHIVVINYGSHNKYQWEFLLWNTEFCSFDVSNFIDHLVDNWGLLDINALGVLLHP